MLTALAALLALATATTDLATAARAQTSATRVAGARQARDEAVRKLFATAGLTYPPGVLYLRAFKHEGVLEVWGGAAQRDLQLVASYPICARSGELGPKRAAGDLQVPEGFYDITQLNPTSNFHLSLRVSYPNAADRLLGRKGALGGDIFIHGECVTIGCIPIQNEPIEAVYLMALDTALARGALPVHIFPARMDEAGQKLLAELAGDDAVLLAFWRTLAPAFMAFEKTRRVPRVRVNAKSGAYEVLVDGATTAVSGEP